MPKPSHRSHVLAAIIAGSLGIAATGTAMLVPSASALAAPAASTAQKPAVEYYVGNRPASPHGPLAASGAAPAKAAADAPKNAPKIDLNSASEEELATLPGIGEVRAHAIVRNRPYARKDDLVRKKVIPRLVYEGMRERVVAKQKP